MAPGASRSAEAAAADVPGIGRRRIATRLDHVSVPAQVHLQVDMSAPFLGRKADLEWQR